MLHVYILCCWCSELVRISWQEHLMRTVDRHSDHVSDCLSAINSDYPSTNDVPTMFATSPLRSQSPAIQLVSSLPQSSHAQMQSVDLCSASSLGVLVPCEQKCLYQASESSFGGVRITDRVRKTVPGGRASNGKSQGAAVRVESVTWYASLRNGDVSDWTLGFFISVE